MRTRIHRATGSSHPRTSARTHLRIQVSDPSAQSTRTHSYTHVRARARARNDAQRRQRKSPSDQQCGNSERLRATLCESRTTRAATNDLLISPSLRARSPRCTDFPERRNRTVGGAESRRFTDRSNPSPSPLRPCPSSRSYDMNAATERY